VGEEEGPAEGRESPAIKESQSEKEKTEKTEKIKKLDYYEAHKLMHAMYSENAVNDIYDFISDDAIDLDQFACVCDPCHSFYSDISAAAVSSSKFDENTGVARGMVTHTGFGGLLGEVKKVPSVTPHFVAFVSLILKLRLSLPSLPRAMRNLNKTARGLCSTPSPWAFRQELPGGNLLRAAPRSKASSALILKLLSASQQTSHKNKKT